MQYSFKQYDSEKHDLWKALTVKQPYANYLIDNEKTIEVRSRNTSYRGDLMICSASVPVIAGNGKVSGVTLGLVELYDVKPIKDFTPEDWERTKIPKEKREKITKGYGWLMRNARPVVHKPVKGQLGIYNLVFTKGEITDGR